MWVKCGSGKAKKGVSKPRLKSSGCCDTFLYWYAVVIASVAKPDTFSSCDCDQGVGVLSGYSSTDPSSPGDVFHGSGGATCGILLADPIFDQVSPCASLVCVGAWDVDLVPFLAGGGTHGSWVVVQDSREISKTWVRIESFTHPFVHGVDTPFWDFGPVPYPYPGRNPACPNIEFGAIL